MIGRLLLSFFFLAGPAVICAGGAAEQYPNVSVDRRDIAAQQRGAGLFFNHCSSCHSLKQTRFSDIARDLLIVDAQGEIDKDVILKHLNHINDNPYSPVLTSLDPKQAQQWLGKEPPDLSLVARSRGSSWLSAFLKGFEIDESRPWGVNNTVMTNTAMPHVLIDLQGRDESGELLSASHASYEQVVSDLVGFLAYVAEPRALEREMMGKYVLLFLAFLGLVSYLHYKSVWAELSSGPHSYED